MTAANIKYDMLSIIYIVNDADHNRVNIKYEIYTFLCHQQIYEDFKNHGLLIVALLELCLLKYAYSKEAGWSKGVHKPPNIYIIGA